jgi:hypothetical protein
MRERALRDIRERPELAESAASVGLQLLTADEKKAVRRAARKATPRQRRRGRPAHPDDHYREVAVAYLDLQREGFGKGILLELANREGRRLGRPVARETARDWVRGARKRGFLTSGHPGRAGAEPGPNLVQKEETLTRWTTGRDAESRLRSTRAFTTATPRRVGGTRSATSPATAAGDENN